MALRKKIVVVLSFGVVVIIMQMFSISILNSQPPSQLPWEAVERRGEVTSLQHENPEISSLASKALSAPPPRPQQKPPGNVRDPEGAIQNQVRPSDHQIANISSLPPSVPPSKQLSIPDIKEFDTVTPFPVPSQVWNCDISRVKDAMSAMSRAHSKGCKELIQNVTCMHKVKRLYNTQIRNTCPLGVVSGRGFQKVPYEAGKGPPARVVFLMSIHGRAVRQVKRLFKAIYHSDHYYFIHVDSRSDYLHRKLYEELSDFPNIYFPTWRMATIWGGASLLQMLLKALEDLEYVLTDWTWDYFINLSESDYPLRTNEELGKFLRVHRGKNFVKTHGGDLNKFISKQGLDRTFVECDNHMWRVDTRTLPPDIKVDGGSDWIAIHRNYSRYLVTNRGAFLTDLKNYYRFTLLPAESFFHTVLRNGPMCDTFVKTNLRVTNWNRKLGCLCQYKHVVDWCGCSPNDFLIKDIAKLTSPHDHVFFARKFEAIVNQEVIRQLDFHLYGPLPSDLPGLDSYWESVYHSEDTLTKSSNARYTVYQSFLRSSLKQLHSEQGISECSLPKEPVVREVSVYRNSDHFQGLVLTFTDYLSESASSPVFEVFMKPISNRKRFAYEGDIARRLLSLEVGSSWDGKESIFRNHGDILGVWDEPVATVRLSSGHYSEVTLTWDDPVGARVSTYNMKLESGWVVSYHKPKLERPIRPGLWSVKLEMSHGALLMQTDFMVVPLTHENKELLTSPQSLNAKRTEPVGEGAKYDTWKRNVFKEGAELQDWVDELVGMHWNIEGRCRAGGRGGEGGVAGGGGGGGCSMLDCVGASWSTLSPDPKSEIGEVQSNGRLR